MTLDIAPVACRDSRRAVEQRGLSSTSRQHLVMVWNYGFLFMCLILLVGWFFETNSCYVAQAGLELMMLLPQPPNCWGNRRVWPYPATCLFPQPQRFLGTKQTHEARTVPTTRSHQEAFARVRERMQGRPQVLQPPAWLTAARVAGAPQTAPLRYDRHVSNYLATVLHAFCFETGSGCP